ncbi:MAG: hypothetical protein K1V99_06100 [Bacteroidales bacterium]|nr:hypothetical protein [Bacteroidales bacterium]
MKATALYKDLADFRKYADGLEADTSFTQISASIRSAGRDVINIITAEVFASVASLEDESEGKELLKTAVACGALYRYQIFASVKKNNTESKLYKYQHEEIKEHHICAYWLAMDELLDWLDLNPDTGGYSQTGIYLERESLPVRNAKEFNYYYGIDNSSYFFSKVQFLMRTVWKNILKPMLPEKWKESGQLSDLVKRVLCYNVIAEAVMKFDVTELPRSIRYDFNHEYTKGTLMQERAKLYADIMADVNDWKDNISSIVKANTGMSNMQHNQNNESDKFYFT